MIEPSKVKEAFMIVEKENHAFRSFLKNHADPDELDAQFLNVNWVALYLKLRIPPLTEIKLLMKEFC